MPVLCAGFIFLYPLLASSLSLDQKVALKLIESLWQEERFVQAEEEINKFLSKYDSSTCDESLLRLKSDLLIKKKDYKQALSILDALSEKSNFTLERSALCLYELKDFERFVTLFEDHPELHNLTFGQKIWDVGLAEAIASEQNLEKKQILIEKASHVYESDLKDDFDESKALSYALLLENKKEYHKAYELYEELFAHSKQESYQLSMARMLSFFNPKKALEVLESLRWKSGSYGTNAAMFSMQIMDQHEDFHSLYNLSLEELKIAPEGFRKAKIALYHLKSLFYLKIFDRISEFYFTYNPHKILKSQDLQLAVTLICKTFVIRNEIFKLESFYETLEKENQKEAQITAGRILAKNYLEHKDYQKAEKVLVNLHKIDVLHTDEYLTTLGFCYLNSQAYEVAENYFLQVIKNAADKKMRQKAILYLLEIPKLSNLTLEYLDRIRSDLDVKSSPKAALWLAEGYKQSCEEDKALELLSSLEDKQNYKYYQLMGDLLEKKSLQDGIVNYEKALPLAQKNEQKAYIHNKLFINYFDHDKEKAIDHLFQSINLHTLSIPDHLFVGLASYLYEKATCGVRLYIGDQDAKDKASRLLRLFSYKTNLNETDNVIYAKLLRKLCRFEEGLKILNGKNSFEESLELARIYNQLGEYQKCDAILEDVLKKKPYTLFLEGQKALLTKICLQYDRLMAEGQNEKSLEELDKQIRILSVCAQDPTQSLSFEIDLMRHVFFKKDHDDLNKLQFHPFLTSNDSGAYRKILNYIVNNKMTKESAHSIDDNFSDTMEWILIKLFGSQSCAR
jgi:hypothetical protein